MPEEAWPGLDELAAAVADGRRVDWDGIASSAESDDERDAIRRLRAIAAIGQAHAELTFTDSVESLSARSLLDGIEDRCAPATWGSLRILERVGRGRFGDVYRAWDPNLEREVALKLLRRRDDTASSEREVIEEGRVMARVRHPNVLTIYGAQRIDGRSGLWMEFVHGRTLEAELKERGPYAVDEVVQIGTELCRALSAVHSANLVHRDVKAQNVMRDGTGRIVLGDFGAGQEFSANAVESTPLAGTPAYLAPEVLNGAAATRQSDIYSLGVLLYRLTTGTFPIGGRSLAAIRVAHGHRERVSICTLRPEVPSSLAALIERAIAPLPADRFQSSADMECALAGAKAPTGSGRDSVANRRSRAAVFVVVALTAGLIGWSQVRQESAVPEPPSNPFTTPSRVLIPPAPSSIDGVEESPPTSAASGDLFERNTIAVPRAVGVSFVHIDAALERRVNFRRLAQDGIHATCAGVGMQLGVCNLTTGEVRNVRPGTTMDGSGSSLLAPDGKTVVYLWTTDRGKSQSLRVIGVDGGGDRELSRDRTDAALLRVERWTQDARAVIVRRRTSAGTFHLAAIPVDGVSAEQILDFDLPDGNGELSPDGRFLLLAKSAPGTVTRDISITDKNGDERWLLETPSDEHAPFWTPDGRSVVFLSNKLGGTAAFLIHVEDGHVVGPQELIQDFGRSTVYFLGYSGNGSLLVQLITHWVDAFRATVDLDAGILTGLEKLESRSSLEDTASPDWDPAGERIAFVSGAAAQTSMARILIRHSDGRFLREIPLPGRMARGSRLRWSPDGRWIAVSYSGPALDIVDPEGNQRRRLLDATAHFAWSADSKAIYYLDGNVVRRRAIESPEEAVLSNGVRSFDVSRDGSIALTIGAPGGCIVRLVTEQETIDRQWLQPGGECTTIAWSRDGSKLLVGVLTSPYEPAQLWVMNAGPGPAKLISVPTEMISSLSLGPDGKTLLFSAGNPFPESWLVSGIGRRGAEPLAAETSDKKRP